MKDNALIDLLANQLETASAAAGWNYEVLQKAQPSRQGIPLAPTIFFQKLFDRHHGFQMVSETYQSTPNNFDHTETQQIETTFQIGALVPQDAADLSLPTAADVVGYLKMFLQSRITADVFRAQNVGMMRVTDIRNPYFDDDRNRFEASPSFDIILTHLHSISMTVPVIDKIQISILEVP